MTRITIFILILLLSLPIESFAAYQNKSNYSIPYRAEKNVFQLRSADEWDAVMSNGSVQRGTFYSQVEGAYSRAALGLMDDQSANVTIQATVYWDTSSMGVQVGITNASAGELESATSQHRYIGFRGDLGFIYNSGSSITSLSGPENFPSGWYVITMLMHNKEIVASVQPKGGTNAQSFIVQNTLLANNIQIQSNSPHDKIKELKYISYPIGDHILLPIFQSKNYDTPLKLIVDGVETTAYIPPSYDNRKKNEVVIYFHGANGDSSNIWDRPDQNKVISSLLDAGYIVIASDYQNKNSWGNEQSTIDNQKMLTAYQKYLNIDIRPYVFAASMGGIVALNSISHGKIDPKAVVAVYPVTNLASMYGAGDKSFSPAIQEAYEFSFPNSYTSATQGYDPVKAETSNFIDVPMKLWASNADALVLKSLNTDLFADKVNADGGNVEVIEASGGHGDPSHFNPEEIVEFFSKY